MTAVGELMLVLGLLVTAHCEVRARDPEVEEEEGEAPGHPGLEEEREAPGHPGLEEEADGWLGPGAQPLGPIALPDDPAPPTGEAGNYPARTGNWCAFVHRRVVTLAVACGTEKYTIRSQSPCPSGDPACQLVMYKLSTRPVYREKQKMFTALLWRCCPGHGGATCEETVPDGHVSAPDDLVLRPGPGDTGSPDWEQNDFQVSGSPLYEPQDDNDSSTQPSPYRRHDYNHPHDPQQPHNPQPHPQPLPHPHHDHHSYDFGGPITDDVEADAQPYPETPSALPVQQMMALLVSHLQPILDGFNRSLERLSREVGGLSQDVAQLRSPKREGQGEARGGGEGPEALEARLEESYLQIDEVRRQLETQRSEMDERLHSQHAILHYMLHNLTDVKTDVDVKIKHNHRMLQVNLQTMNTTLSDMKMDQERLAEQLQQREPTHHPGEQRPPSQAQQPTDQDLARQQEKVDDSTVRVSSLVEDMKDLKSGCRQLEQNLTQAGRNTQILFMEIGLEVEAAKVAVLSRLRELDSNLTLQLQEVGSDVDYLYTQIYDQRSRNTSGGSCDCDKGFFSTTVSHLERALANVTELAKDYRLALEGVGGLGLPEAGGSDHWGGEVGWGPSMEDLHQGLQQVKESLAFEQDRSRTLHRNVSQLTALLLGGQRDVHALQEEDVRLAGEMRHLSGSFSSLLQDAIRHTDVLERLLGEEVLDFLDWPVQRQKAHSVPALQESVRDLQGRLRDHDLRLASLLTEAAAASEAEEETPAADQPSRGLERRSGDRRRGHPPHPRASDDRPDYSDSDLLWGLEKAVEELRVQVRRLDERPCNNPNPANCNTNTNTTNNNNNNNNSSSSSSSKEAPSGGADAKLQAEVARLRRGLEGHLRLFENVFSNSEGLAGSESTLDLDKMWAMMKRKEGRREKKRSQKREEAKEAGRTTLRSSRDTSALSPLEDSRLLFLASGGVTVSAPEREGGTMAFSAMPLNCGQAYSAATGTFTAPVTGVYLFLLTLKLERGGGPSLVHLRTASAVAASLHHQGEAEVGPATRLSLLRLGEGEEVHLHLAEGRLVTQPGVNTFAGLLLYP